jgi:hypothetical protein
MSQDYDSVIHARLKGYAPRPGSAVVHLASCSASTRMRRAVSALGGAWLLAAASVFIPIAHFLLVPGFGVLGVVLFVSRWRVRDRVTQAEGTCPDCGSDMKIQIGGNWNPPHRVSCSDCQRSLVLEPVESP